MSCAATGLLFSSSELHPASTDTARAPAVRNAAERSTARSPTTSWDITSTSGSRSPDERGYDPVWGIWI